MAESSSATTAAKTLAVVEGIFDEMGLGGHSKDALLVDPKPSGSDVVLRSAAEFGGFIQRFSIRTGCIPYAPDAVRNLTVREFCGLYVRESYPEPPETALEDDDYTLGGRAPDDRAVFAPQEFPICFVLGCGRSGTTLFRAMLNVHDALWAPGELHLAEFDTMRDRATRANPFLRRALVPEAASRFSEAPAEFATRLETWERTSLPVPQAYRRFHDADPRRMIVDKCPPYSTWLEHLEWIIHHFIDAKFIHLIRNPHDVIRSYVRMQLYKLDSGMFGAGVNPYQIAETLWFRHNVNIAEALREIGDQRSLLVRFEDLVADPQTILSGVCGLLGVSFQPRMANPYEGDCGHVALGAGDPRVNLLTEVEKREPSKPFYPLGEKCQQLARLYGY